ncbi:YbaB/EbfC family nucleoid-associated protein, partial [Actinomyces qiguomingii]|uniref:YbaB/EbfC family nucleoid-associated protein n=1 Tax=Actinomyces qiguomingii TaxID=2057800 RepID=UPI003A103554
MRERAEGIRVKGSSRGREVSVEVDVAGRLLGITFLPASEGLSLRGLSDAVMMAMADARRRAGEQVRLV